MEKDNAYLQFAAAFFYQEKFGKEKKNGKH